MSDYPPRHLPASSETWENEGGSLKPNPNLERFGIVRHLVESYSVGGYRYAKLADAMAQSRRMASRPGAAASAGSDKPACCPAGV